MAGIQYIRALTLNACKLSEDGCLSCNTTMRLLVPLIVKRIVFIGSSSHASGDMAMNILEESINTLVAMVVATQETRLGIIKLYVARALVSLIVPLLLSLVTITAQSNAFTIKVSTFALQSQLHLASTYPVHFKEAVAQMGDEDRIKLENGLKQAMARNQQLESQDSDNASLSAQVLAGPQKIQLKMFGQ